MSVQTSFTVSQLTQAIKSQLEKNFTALTVKGEVTNLRQQASGHIYFSLKDEHAQISAVLFSGNARRSSYLPKIGDQVMVRGELGVYAPRGTYQIIVREISHAGLGELLLKLEQLKEKCAERGWLDATKKKPLPLFPKTIGVVTSPTGAVIQDILHVLRRRYPRFHLILNPVKVQGVGAAEEIAQAIGEFNRLKLADVLIIGRGGGSLEDLWAFNEEIVAKAIYDSTIPIVSAVGHETDLTLADCIADVRAPTPSAAAELTVRELSSQLDFLRTAYKRCQAHLRQVLTHSHSQLMGIKRHPFILNPLTLLAEKYQNIDRLSDELSDQMKQKMHHHKLRLYALKKQLQGLSPQNQLHAYQTRLLDYHKTLQNQITSLLKQKKHHLQTLRSHLQSINPKNLLKKGYCIPFSEKEHSVIMSTHAVKAGERILLKLHDGTLTSTIDGVKSHD